MTLETAEPGLRERKRLATRRAIQLAAIGIVRDSGLERLTVDEIGRLADISPRTFFNYFPSKEAAIIGDPPGLPPGDRVADFIQGRIEGGILSGLGALLNEALEPSAHDHELTQLRRSVLKQHPQLFAMRVLTMKHFEEELQAIVEQRLRHDKAPLTDEALVSRAHLVTLVAMAAMRHAWISWADADGSSDLADQLGASFRDLETLLAHSPTR